MHDKASILVVEDERVIRKGLLDVLAFRGYAPMGADNGEDGLREALTGSYALVVLDVMMPGLDGFTVCQRIRERLPRQAVMMLTARGSEDDVLEGFRCGADDYVAKPFSVAQLLARVEALLRRAGAVGPGRLRLGPVVIDGDELRATSGDRSVDLTRRDIDVLARLLGAGERITSREELLTEVWGYARVEAVETRAVDMHIVKLRKKLDAIGAEDLIETVRGAGYRLSRKGA